MHIKLASSLMILAMLIAGCSVVGVETQTATQISQPSATSMHATATQEPVQDQESLSSELSYVIVDSGQVYCYDHGGSIACPEEGAGFSGQDAQYAGNLPRYVDNADGTVTDLNTGLMWQQDPGSKMSYNEAVVGASSFQLAGYDDWRLPTIKELYSLILFSGDDPSGCSTMDACPGVEAFIEELKAFGLFGLILHQ